MLIKPTNRKLTLNTLITAIFTVIVSAVFSASVFAQATVDQVTEEGEKRADAGAADQQRVEQVANQTDKLLTDYKTVTKVVDDLEITVEIADGVKVRVQRGLISTVLSKTEPVKEDKKSGGSGDSGESSDKPGIMGMLFGGKK